MSPLLATPTPADSSVRHRAEEAGLLECLSGTSSVDVMYPRTFRTLGAAGFRGGRLQTRSVARSERLRQLLATTNRTSPSNTKVPVAWIYCVHVRLRVPAFCCLRYPSHGTPHDVASAEQSLPMPSCLLDMAQACVRQGMSLLSKQKVACRALLLGSLTPRTLQQEQCFLN